MRRRPVGHLELRRVRQGLRDRERACAVTSCTPGFGDCDGDPKDGCEANLKTDLQNCSACGKACGALPNAVVACDLGACHITACKPGFVDCDMVPADGCEVQLDADP